MGTGGGGFWELFSTVGRALVRSVPSLVFVLALGLLAAQNLDDVRLQAVTFAIALAIAIVTAVQAAVPMFSWRSYVPESIAKYLDAATQAFLGTFLAGISSFLATPDWSAWRSIVTGVLVAAGTALVRAVQALFTPGEPVLDTTKEPKRETRSVFATAPATQ